MLLNLQEEIMYVCMCFEREGIENKKQHTSCPVVAVCVCVYDDAMKRKKSHATGEAL
jgi:hypothetical protein